MRIQRNKNIRVEIQLSYINIRFFCDCIFFLSIDSMNPRRHKNRISDLESFVNKTTHQFSLSDICVSVLHQLNCRLSLPKSTYTCVRLSIVTFHRVVAPSILLSSLAVSAIILTKILKFIG